MHWGINIIIGNYCNIILEPRWDVCISCCETFSAQRGEMAMQPDHAETGLEQLLKCYINWLDRFVTWYLKWVHYVH